MTVAGRGCFVVVVFVVVVIHHGNGFFSVFLSLRHCPALNFSFSHKKVEESASDDDTSADEEDDSPLGFRALRDKGMDWFKEVIMAVRRYFHSSGVSSLSKDRQRSVRFEK